MFDINYLIKDVHTFKNISIIPSLLLYNVYINNLFIGRNWIKSLFTTTQITQKIYKQLKIMG